MSADPMRAADGANKRASERSAVRQKLAHLGDGGCRLDGGHGGSGDCRHGYFLDVVGGW